MSIAESGVTTQPFGSVHALMRAAERYRVALDDRDFDRMVMLIERDDPRAIRFYPRPQENGNWPYAVFHRDRWIAAVYSPSARMIVTVLPPRVLEPYRDQLERLRATIE